MTSPWPLVTSLVSGNPSPVFSGLEGGVGREVLLSSRYSPNITHYIFAVDIIISLLLLMITRQSVIVQSQEAGDQLRPARSSLRVMHPATLNHLANKAIGYDV